MSFTVIKKYDVYFHILLWLEFPWEGIVIQLCSFWCVFFGLNLEIMESYDTTTGCFLKWLKKKKLNRKSETKDDLK